MSLFRNIVFTAVVAGLLSGLLLTAMQSFSTVPLIMEAETFESAGDPVAAGEGISATEPAALEAEEEAAERAAMAEWAETRAEAVVRFRRSCASIPSNRITASSASGRCICGARALQLKRPLR